MFASLPQFRAARLVGAIALALGLAGASPAGADATQWQRPHTGWNQGSGWNRPWHSQTHVYNHFNNGARVIIGGGSGVVFVSPGLVIGGPGFVVGQPTFVRRNPNFIYQRPSFARKQWQFIQRHPSLQAGRPWWRNNWNHRHWQHNNNWAHGGMGYANPRPRFTTPGMRFTTPGMRFTTQ